MSEFRRILVLFRKMMSEVRGIMERFHRILPLVHKIVIFDLHVECSVAPLIYKNIYHLSHFF